MKGYMPQFYGQLATYRSHSGRDCSKCEQPLKNDQLVARLTIKTHSAKRFYRVLHIACLIEEMHERDAALKVAVAHERPPRPPRERTPRTEIPALRKLYNRKNYLERKLIEAQRKGGDEGEAAKAKINAELPLISKQLIDLKYAEKGDRDWHPEKATGRSDEDRALLWAALGWAPQTQLASEDSEREAIIEQLGDAEYKDRLASGAVWYKQDGELRFGWRG